MSIQRLPGDVAAQIKSSTTVASLHDVVLGLLRNALDAGAARVTISVDYGRGGCVVEDDGSGIWPAEFLSYGGLGKHYYTSKYPPSKALHGRHGTFLASTAALSLMTIVSRCKGFDSESTLVIHNGKFFSQHTSALERKYSVTTPHGTRVTVQDLFGCMPVRARLRPSPESITWSREWNSLIRSALALLLAWPSDVSVSIEDKVCGTKRSLHALHSQGPRQGQDGISRTVRLLSQAGLCEVANPSSWVQIEASVPGVRISGIVSLEPAASKRTQFIRVGIEPLSEAHHADGLYGEIDKIFVDSNFGAALSKKDGSRRDARGPIDRFVREQRPSKLVDRWPMFCLGIDLEDAVDVDDVLDDRRQHLATITGLLRTMFTEFLKTHGFYDSTTTLYGPDDGLDTAPPSPTKKQRTMYKDESPRLAHKMPRSDKQKLPEPSKTSHTPNSLFSSWPQTKSARSAKSKSTSTDNFVPTNVKKPSQAEETSRFFTTSDLVSEDGNERNDINDEPECCVYNAVKICDSAAFTSETSKISRGSLETATVIGQVDHKFILIRAPVGEEDLGQSGQVEGGASGPLLILVDQHAADERCRVEALLQDYFISRADSAGFAIISGADTTLLEQPLQFELAANERPFLDRAQGYFQHWGVVYDVLPTHNQAEVSSTLLRVRGLPASIAERCRQEPRLVIDLIRKEIWAQNEAGLAVPHYEPGETWTVRLHGCPRGIVDLVNSRACRSAIKFNDPLTHEECVDLLSRLRHCSFPFQCAHGRPSMVPLLSLGPEEEE